MACRGKDKIKLKKDEIEFRNKRIDLKSFAYDVIKYTALKFHVPESCIALYQGSENDYGYDDFFEVLCSEIIRYQMTNRFRYHTTFCKHYKSNKLASSKLIGMLLQEVINKEIEEPSLTPLHKVEISLSVVCELFLYLYSNDMDLNPKQLTTTWFQCYLNINKKHFENAGGLEEMYREGSRSKVDGMDAFIDKFIEDNCLPYSTTANNPDLKEIYLEAIHERNRKAAESLPPKDCEEMMKILERVKEMGKLSPMRLNSKNGEAVAVKPPKPDAALQVNLSHNPRLGIIPHDEVMLHFFGPSVASSHAPSASTEPSHETSASTVEQQRRHRALSYKERMKKKSSLRERVEQVPEQLNLHSLRTKQSTKEAPCVSVAKDAQQTYNLQGAKYKYQVENGKSSASQRRKSSSCSSMEQGPGQSSLDFHLHGAETEVKNGGSSASQTSKPSSCSSMEQGPGQPSSDFNLHGAKSETEVKNGGSPASQTSKPSLGSGVENRPGQSSSDFHLHGAKSETEGKNGGSSASQTGKSSLCSGMQQGPAPFSLDFNLLEHESETEVENGGSSTSETSILSLCSNVKQGLGRLGSVSSEAKQSSQKKPDMLVTSDPTS